jgi:hypothetical protein
MLVSNDSEHVAWMLARLAEWAWAQASRGVGVIVDALMRCQGFSPIVTQQTPLTSGNATFLVPDPLAHAMNSSEPGARHLAREVLFMFLRNTLGSDDPAQLQQQFLALRGYPLGRIRLVSAQPGAERELQIPQQYAQWLVQGSRQARRDNMRAMRNELAVSLYDNEEDVEQVARDLASFLYRTARQAADRETPIDILAAAFEAVYDLHPNGSWTGGSFFDDLANELRPFPRETLAPAMLRAAGAVVMHHHHLSDLFGGLSEHLFDDDVTDAQFRDRLAQVRGDLPAALDSRELKPVIANRFKRQLFERIARLPPDEAEFERRETLTALDRS